MPKRDTLQPHQLTPDVVKEMRSGHRCYRRDIIDPEEPKMIDPLLGEILLENNISHPIQRWNDCTPCDASSNGTRQEYILMKSQVFKSKKGNPFRVTHCSSIQDDLHTNSHSPFQTKQKHLNHNLNNAMRLRVIRHCNVLIRLIQ
jgi:hypothetical protein